MGLHDEQGLKRRQRSATIAHMAPDAEKDDNSKTSAGSNPTAPVNLEFIERCQIEYERNPTSRVFAPLAEGYRRLKLMDEAFDVASRGVRHHPEFAAGRIAFARILIEKEAYSDAVDQLKKAAELSPDNILAFLLLGETLLKLRRPKEALEAFKMVLFLNPLHDRALKMVKKWEFLTADEFEDEVFEWSNQDLNLGEAPQTKPPTITHADREANRAISIADALTVRNDIEGAFEQVRRATQKLGLRPDLEHRLTLLGKRMGLKPEEALALASVPQDNRTSEVAPPVPREPSPQELKRKKLQNLLKKVQRKSGDN